MRIEKQKRTIKTAFAMMYEQKSIVHNVLQARKEKKRDLKRDFYPRTIPVISSSAFYFIIFCSFARFGFFKNNFYDENIFSENYKIMYAYCSNLFRC